MSRDLLLLLANTNASVNGSGLGAGLGLSSETAPTLFRMVITYMDIYVVPMVALVGVLGNMLSFTVFLCTFMRRLSSSIYLAALALADLGFLVCVLVSWTVNVGLDIYAQNGWCQTFIYLTYVSSFLSVWYVVSFTTERYIVVHFPLRRQDLCTTRRAKYVVSALAVFSLCLYTFGTWTTGVNTMYIMPVCGPLPRFHTFISIVHNLDTVITLILPFLAILIMNVRIAYKVAQFYQERRHLQLHAISYTRGTMSFRRGHIQVYHKTNSMYTRTQVRVTKMLLTVSTIFLVLNLPRHTVRTYSFIRTLTDKDYNPTETYILWQKFFQFLYYLQFSVNLFLYSAFGRNFRKALLLLWRKVKHNVVAVLARTAVIRANGSLFRAGGAEITLRDYRHFSGESRYV